MNKTKLVYGAVLSSMLCSTVIYAQFLDPTRPPNNINGQTLVAPNAFVLNAVVIGHDRKIAVINGIDKKVGDEILGEHITAIHENTVQLEGPSGKITLFLFDKPMKRLSTNRK